MVALGLLLSLVFGAVVCGGLGSIARQKNVQVHYHLISFFSIEHYSIHIHILQSLSVNRNFLK